MLNKSFLLFFCFFVDQEGRLKTAFQIKNVPAVAQQGAFLKIDEVVVSKKEGLE